MAKHDDTNGTSQPAGVSQQERYTYILSELARASSVGVADLAARINVSQATVRRDLAELEEKSLLTRVHGGAVRQGVAYELPLRYRSSEHSDEKRRITLEAAKRIPESAAAIGLGGGTTVSSIVAALVDLPALTVVTNALNIAWELAMRENIKLVVTGGVVRTKSFEMVGPLADVVLDQINLDVVFFGADGVSPDAGLTTFDEVEAHTNGVMLRRARRAIALADGSKIGRAAFAQICEATRIDELITDSSADPAQLAQLEALGVTVTRV